MEYFEMACEIGKYKTRAEHYMRVLEDVKETIQLAIDNDENMKKHFARVMKELDANGVVCCYDKKVA